VTSPSTARTPPPSLVAALLTVADLPGGFSVAPPRVTPKYVYDPARCGTVVAVGHLITGDHVASVEFVNTATRSRVLEHLYHYTDPVPYLQKARDEVSQCTDYTITDAAGHRTAIHATITTEPTSSGAFVAQVTATGAVPVDETLAAQQAGQNLVVLALTGPTPPDSQTMTYLVRAAVARAQKA
jgi:hypothetical protein